MVGIRSIAKRSTLYEYHLEKTHLLSPKNNLYKVQCQMTYGEVLCQFQVSSSEDLGKVQGNFDICCVWHYDGLRQFHVSQL
jgi:hypothetical protein